ncbi:MAG: Na(+)-translocating NADH-quinone reductase subunit A [Bacteroidales bacterium]|nr:Na(+)-translocating NADH-quinone reductase subunit A [Bacteroidales bacterium]
MSEVIKIKKGLNIKLKGEADKIRVQAPRSATYAVKPVDFQSLTPKIDARPCDEVKVGTTLFHDKYRPEIRYSSPVSGKVLSILRGERRRIISVVVEDDGKDTMETFLKGNPNDLTREQIIKNLLDSGMWPMIRQRPFNIVANPQDVPKSIFISGFDTAPLAPDYDYIMKDQLEDFQWGIDALRKLTSGKIHLNQSANYPVVNTFRNIRNVQINSFSGPHPAGNAGIQIHHIDPINKNERVWIVQPQEVSAIGRLFRSGNYDPKMIVALTGSEVKKPLYYRVIRGAEVSTILQDNVGEGDVRYISGNVLSGRQVPADGHLGYYAYQLTVIPEGKHHEMFGWIKPGLSKFSASRTFLSWMIPNRKYRLDTNMHGGERAFVMTGEYNKVLPMNILPVQLLKSILVEDIDRMEQLGIYEVCEEDLALCEFVCTSKTPVTAILRKGLDTIRKEME